MILAGFGLSHGHIPNVVGQLLDLCPPPVLAEATVQEFNTGTKLKASSTKRQQCSRPKPSVGKAREPERPRLSQRWQQRENLAPAYLSTCCDDEPHEVAFSERDVVP